jgi:hypothetical protein
MVPERRSAYAGSRLHAGRDQRNGHRGSHQKWPLPDRLPVHKKQLLTYLRLADMRLGLLINFHVALIKDGITRIVNGLEDDDHAKSPSRKEV